MMLLWVSVWTAPVRMWLAAISSVVDTDQFLMLSTIFIDMMTSYVELPDLDITF